MTTFEIMQDMAMANEFRQIYGMRFVGLADPGSQVYGQYTYPNAEAPYPRDIVIDQEGIVRYWSTEYDPQAIIAVIESLLQDPASVDPPPPGAGAFPRIARVSPNPWSSEVRLDWSVQGSEGRLEIFDALGRLVRAFPAGPQTGNRLVRWDGRDRAGRQLPAGIYLVRASDRSGSEERRTVRLR